MRDAAPAPASTITSKPSPARRFTVSGEAATRGSFASISRGMKTDLSQRLLPSGWNAASAAIAAAAAVQWRSSRTLAKQEVAGARK